MLCTSTANVKNREISTDDKKNIDLKALFLGDRDENIDFYKSTLTRLIDDHVGWRKNYMPQAPAAVSIEDMQAPEYKGTLLKTAKVLDELSRKMCEASVPCCTAGRYWGICMPNP